jgi:transcription elongation factor GreA
MAVTDVKVTWLTRDAYDRLAHELDELIANRPVIAAEINARREEGDLKENGGYHAAREEQGQQEARIRQLRELLRTAKVGQAPRETDVAAPGMILTVRYGDDDTETFLLGSREEGQAGGLEVYSPNSPLGAAILGAKVGETRHYHLPNGATMTVTLEDSKVFPGADQL